MYDVSVAVHVAAAVVGFGATFSYPVLQLLGERGDGESLAFALGAILAVSRWVAVPATVVVGATGVYQLVAGPYELRDVWLALGLVLYLAIMGVAARYLAPAYERARGAAAVGSLERYREEMRGVNVVGPLVAVAVLTVVALMVLKPG